MDRAARVVVIAGILILAGLTTVVVLASLHSASAPPTQGNSRASCSASGGGGGGAQGNWTTYHRDGARAGVQARAHVAQVAAAWAQPANLDGAVYAEPLVCANVLYVATEGDSVYALNASTGAQIWFANLGTPVPGSSLPCGDIDPSGISGTPVIDTISNTLYVVAFFAPANHQLFALDDTTGKVRFQVSVDPPGSTSSVQQQRGALALANGYVYVPFGGLYGDCGPYHGWVVGVQKDGSGGLLSYQVPTGREGGVWGTAGITVEVNGDLLVATGNGASSTTFDYGDSVIRLSPTLAQLDYFAPSNWAQLNAGDTDLGSEAPTLLSSGIVFQIGKAGVGYALSETHLGGIGGELYSGSVCGGAYAATAVVGSSVLVPCVDGLYKVVLGAGSLSVAWGTSSFDAGAPIVTGDTVWVVNVTTPDLLGFNLTTGQQMFSFPLGSAEHFISPAASPKDIFVAGGSEVYAFSLG